MDQADMQTRRSGTARKEEGRGDPGAAASDLTTTVELVVELLKERLAKMSAEIASLKKRVAKLEGKKPTRKVPK